MPGEIPPFGVVNEDTGELHLAFGSPAKTSDFIVDCLYAWWEHQAPEVCESLSPLQIKREWLLTLWLIFRQFSYPGVGAAKNCLNHRLSTEVTTKDVEKNFDLLSWVISFRSGEFGGCNPWIDWPQVCVVRGL